MGNKEREGKGGKKLVGIKKKGKQEQKRDRKKEWRIERGGRLERDTE